MIGKTGRRAEDRGKDMKKQGYLIGEIAALLGVSRDTLRIYEEKGLITPERDHNGFRRYSETDLFRLLPIVFYRDSAFTMKAVGELMQTSSAEEKKRLIREQMARETLALQEHQRNLNRLKIAMEYFDWEDLSHLHYEIRKMPEFFVVSEAKPSMGNTMMDWFQLGRKDKDLCLSYLNGEYRLRNGKAELRYCYLILSQDEITSVKEQETEGFFRRIGGAEALHTIILKEGPLPTEAQLDAVMEEADRRGLILEGTIYAHFLWSYEQEDRIMYAVQIYAPLKQEKDEKKEKKE